MVGIDSSDSDYNTSEKTGGSKTTTLTADNLPSHTHTYDKAASTSGTSTITIPTHSHNIKGMNLESTTSYGSAKLVLQADGNLVKSAADGSSGHTWSTGTSSSPATKTCYVVTVGNGSTTLSSTGGGTAHGHSISTTSTDTNGGTGSSSGLPVKDPYVVVYMWKRTA